MAIFQGREVAGYRVIGKRSWGLGTHTHTAQYWKHTAGEQSMHGLMSVASLFALAIVVEPEWFKSIESVHPLLEARDELANGNLLAVVGGVSVLSFWYNSAPAWHGTSLQGPHNDESKDPAIGTRHGLVGGLGAWTQRWTT